LAEHATQAKSMAKKVSGNSLIQLKVADIALETGLAEPTIYNKLLIKKPDDMSTLRLPNKLCANY
jgi:hypothetical protein